ncbi:MAG TPA: response regulator transcription factor [Gemmatimonadaceae bacterium]|jgi:Response regulators consisting of a CheY-like receiver domain and a winged-helix DNA-binding domain
MTRLLVIDDDHVLTNRVSAALRWRGHEVVEADTADEGRALALEQRPRPDLVMLSVALSLRTNPPLLPAIRRGGYSGPILVWHSSREEADITRSFRSGADQYITMPFGMGEISARVAASLARTARRSEAKGLLPILAAPAVRKRYAFGGVEVDLVAREVYRRGEAVSLSPLEFELLVALLRREGAATPRGDLLREVWKYGPGVMSRTLDTHILNLRTKLEDEPGTPRHILTVRKIGYRLDR